MSNTVLLKIELTADAAVTKADGTVRTPEEEAALIAEIEGAQA